MKSPEQALVDIVFSVALAVKNSAHLQELDNEELAEWVRKQLLMCGFETIPMGISWGMLKNSTKPNPHLVATGVLCSLCGKSLDDNHDGTPRTCDDCLNNAPLKYGVTFNKRKKQ